MKPPTRNLTRLTLSAVIGVILAIGANPVSGALLAHFTFNDNLDDETGNHNATLRDSTQTALFEPGITGNAVVVHGAATSLDLANPGTVDLGSSFTISAWVNYMADGERCVVFKGTPSSWGAGNKQFNVFAGGTMGGNGLFIYGEVQTAEERSTAAFGTSFLDDYGLQVNDGNWHFVAVTYDATAGTNSPHTTLWMDGIAKHGTDPGSYATGDNPSFAAGDAILEPDPAGAVLRVGGREAGSGDYTAFSGLIDELQIYNRVLTTNEIQTLFNNPGETIPPGDMPEIVAQPKDQTVTIGPTVGATANFSVVGDGKPPLSYQWQFNGTNLTGQTSDALALSVTTTDQAGPYTVVVSTTSGSITSAVATLTVNLDNVPPTITYARTLGSPNQVTIAFSEPVAAPPGSASFAIDNGITVTGVAHGDATNTIVLTTSAFAVGQTNTLTIENGVKDVYGNEIAANSQKQIDLQVEVPIGFGLPINGFQDDFTGATRNSNWVPVPAENDAYVQANGVLNITTLAGNPNHLLYEATGYSSEAQEVLLRMRFRTLAEPAANAIVGAAVGANPDDTHPGAGINFLLSNTYAPTTGMHAQMLNDYIAWGPVVPNFVPQANTWYWLRLRQTSTNTAAGPNIFAKAWLADGTQPEPADWQINWAQAGRAGFAGIKGPSDNGETDVDVDYILIMAAGLPSIQMAPSAFSLVPPSTLVITQQPQDVSTPEQTMAVFTVSAAGQNLTYQWQMAPSGSANFANIAGANSSSYQTPTLTLSDNGNKYRCVVGALLVPTQNSDAATLTVTADNTPPTLVSAKTLGNPNQVTVVFSEPVQDAVAANFTIDNDVTVTGVSRNGDTNTILVATSALTADKKYTLTANGVKDRSGNAIAADSQIAIDTFVEVPLDFGQTVNGFQDDFAGATRNPNWVAVPADNDMSWVQANGVLTITNMLLNPNHLLYSASGYSDNAQEVLVRIRFKTLAVSGANAIVGPAVACDPVAPSTGFPGDGINMLLLNTFPGGIEGPHIQFLDDHLAWGPAITGFVAEFNTWYWMRLLQTTNVSGGAANIFGKAWKADGSEPEPADWQATWNRDGRAGLAGIKGPSENADTEADVDYILIKAAGLPNIKVASSSFALIGPPPPPPAIVQGASDNYIAFETDTKVTLRNAPLTLWAVTNDTPASGGSALYATGDNQTANSSSFALYYLKFAKPGTYAVYYSWRADQRITDSNNSGGNSFRLPIGFGDLPNDANSTNFNVSASNLIVPASNVYTMTHDTNLFTVTQAQVDAGQPLIFKIGTRELGLFLDRFVLSTDTELTEAQFNALPNSGAPSTAHLDIALQGNNVVISWTGTGTLQSADQVTGPWSDVDGATSPMTITPSGNSRFYRLRQ
ncbi:MAG: hypothetical protein M1608_08985 [Candidatus Omnitrophica bacterium]|nr:hypothetical protein [Candidatus Omnitrophota bacterium]